MNHVANDEHIPLWQNAGAIKPQLDEFIPKDTPTNGVVRLVDDFTHEGPNGAHRCLVFECMGPNILQLIKKYNFKGVPHKLVRKVSAHVLLGLSYLRDICNIIHTDLKPENILVSCPYGVPIDKLGCPLIPPERSTPKAPVKKMAIEEKYAACLQHQKEQNELAEKLLRERGPRPTEELVSVKDGRHGTEAVLTMKYDCSIMEIMLGAEQHWGKVCDDLWFKVPNGDYFVSFNSSCDGMNASTKWNQVNVPCPPAEEALPVKKDLSGAEAETTTSDKEGVRYLLI